MGVQLIGIGGTAEDIIVTSEDTTLRSALQARAHTPADDAARTRPLMMPRAHANRWGSIDEEPLARLVGKRWEGGGSAGAQGPGRDLGRQGEKARRIF